MTEVKIKKGTKKNKTAQSKTPRNPFALSARKRIAGPIKDRSEKRLQNKQQKEKQEEDQSWQ
ncbi:MAG: hypothetical protein AAB035_03545 [Nitrospirota bacterium]